MLKKHGAICEQQAQLNSNCSVEDTNSCEEKHMQCSYQNYQLTRISCTPVALTFKKEAAV